MNTKKMQVLSIEQTGHIVAAFTRAAAPDSLFDVKARVNAALAGTDLLVRNLAIQLPVPAAGKAGGEILSVPMDLLKAEIVELNEKAFVMPFNFMVGGGQANDLRVTVPGTLAATLRSTFLTIDIDPTGTVTVPEETKVWAQVQENEPLLGNEPIRRIVAGTIKPLASGIGNGHSVQLDLTTRPNEQPAAIPAPGGAMIYSVLVLVAGRQPGFFTNP